MKERKVGTLVAEAALVETKRPVRYLGGRADDLSILLGNLDRASLATSEEVKVQNAADDIILQSG